MPRKYRHPTNAVAATHQKPRWLTSATATGVLGGGVASVIGVDCSDFSVSTVKRSFSARSVRISKESALKTMRLQVQPSQPDILSRHPLVHANDSPREISFAHGIL